MDPEKLNNYRPVSNISCVAKLLEKVVSAGLENYLNQNSLHCERQSAYRANPSTEIAVLRIQNDLVEAVVLVLLDLSAAFDTLDHTILLKRLKIHYSITGTVLEWLRSYTCISHHNQLVIVDGEVSEPSSLECGVPHGLVLGPKLYSMYTMPLGIELQRGVKDFHYADDIQLSDSFIDKDNTRQNECEENTRISEDNTRVAI